MDTTTANTTVTAGDIARLVDVGRAAVSNWRRRHADFPKPVGGTTSSPLFSLPEVEDWLRRNGKSFSVSLADRVWQRLRTTTDDLRLGELVCRAGLLLVGHAARDEVPAGPPLNVPLDDPELAGPLAELTEQRGALATFEFLCARYQEAHSRQLAETPADLANLMVRLVRSDHGPGYGTLLDPACGLGGRLIAGTPARALGQDSDPTSACIAAIRLLLRGVGTTVRTGDALRHDTAPDGDWPDEPVDAVVCAPPAVERAWGDAGLTGDPRWAYGVPPRGEPELAWVQHCLAHVRPGGLVALLLPATVAGRRSGRRIRGNLLRAGALRAVLSTSPGGPDLWLLRRPEPGEPAPAQVLLFAADGKLSAAESAWQAYRREPSGRMPGVVRVIDLLDEHVDLSPARHTAGRAGADFAERYAAAQREFRTAAPALPELTVLPHRESLPVITIGELVKAGAVTIEHTTGAVLLPGDVVAARTGEARVVTDTGGTLAAQLTRYRVDPQRVDPEFLAGVLRSAASRLPAGSSRIDPRRTPMPRLPLDEQRAYGRAFTALVAVAEHAKATAALAERLAGLGFEGLLDGHLSPGPP